MSDRAISIRCRAVAKTYRSGAMTVPALRGIDLDVRANELMMLVGPSGCGKTTLISVIAGILDRDPGPGECEVFGNDFSKMSRAQITAFRAKNIGFVFQAFNLLPTLTAAENAAVPLLINRMPRRQAIAKAKETLDLVGLGERANSLPNQLSGGQQQRVAIARALVHGPRLIVCDEPTSALDHDTGQRVMALLRNAALGPDKTLLIVTHDARIFGYADRVAHLDDGRVERIEDKPAEPQPELAHVS